MLPPFNPELAQLFEKCIRDVRTIDGVDFQEDMSMLSSLLLNLAKLSQEGDKKLSVYFVLPFPLEMFGKLFREFCIRLRLVQNFAELRQFKYEIDSLLRFHSVVSSDASESMRIMMEALCESPNPNAEKILPALVILEKHVYGLQERINLMEQLLSALSFK